MLQLQQTFTGYPATGLQFIRLPHETLLLYPSGDAILILNSQTLALHRVLTFWDAFPDSIRTVEKISFISVDSGMKLIVAAISSRIVAWSLPGMRQDTWRIHSTLVLPKDHVVTALDNKAGLLAVGTERGLSIYTLVLENDLLSWSQKWLASALPVTHVSFAPSLMYIATVSKMDNSIRLYSTTSGRQTQLLPHPRPVTKLAWRRSEASSRDNLILYTISIDSALRIYLPVLDSPECLQLHACLDLFSSLPFSVALSQIETHSTIFWLDRRIIGDVLQTILKTQSQQEDVPNKRIKEIQDEGWDLFLRVLGDGSVVVTAVSNIDRRPPTLLKQFTLQQSQPSIFAYPPAHLYTLPNLDPSLLTMVTTTPLMSFELSPLAFFDAKSHGLHLIASTPERIPAEESEVLRLVRTPEGRGVGVIRANGGGEAWTITDRGTKLVRTSCWKNADFMVVLAQGHQFATFLQGSGLLTLHSSPPQTLTLPPLESLFTIPSPSGCEFIVGITADYSIIQIKVVYPDTSLEIVSHNRLPISSTPKLILPVDPMAWGLTRAWTEHDVLLSVSQEGELAFWVPETSDNIGWRCTGKVRTGRSGFRKARCSSMKKTALVVGVDGYDELTIWDSTESEFATGLEYRGTLSERIFDLDWCSTPDMQSILAVGYQRHVDILCQQRMTYFDEGPGWALCHKIEIDSFTPYSISDSIWMAHGSFLVSSGQQLFLFTERAGNKNGTTPEESLFQYVALQNGPLVDYHPQMLLQCLLWGKVELVKGIIGNLAQYVRRRRDGHQDSWNFLPLERFLQSGKSSPERVGKKRYSILFNEATQTEEQGFSRALVAQLIEYLESYALPHLSPNEQAHLLVLIQTTLEIDEQRRALDDNGLRYLISMRSFYISNRRASPDSLPSNGSLPAQTGRRERLRYRDMIWAFHSESQDLLLSSSTAACKGKMTWSDAKALGIALWITSPETLKRQFEVIARNEYMVGDARDPTACSLYYFALGKAKLVQGLWRQAAWHKEQAVMLKFLSNDFSEPRWRTAALKNAFALLSKRRFEYAAAFFLLGGSLKDAVNVCVKQLKDFQLAVVIARIVEQSNEGPILKEILSNTVLPIAFRLGNRWLGSWAFWLLHRRDLAVRILLTPLQDIASTFGLTIEEITETHYDDPSLALLFSQLRSKTLQAAKGTSEISGRSEFNFVLQMSRVFCRMGCHVLGLDLVRSWSFARPSTAVHPEPVSSVSGNGSTFALTSPRPLFPLEPALGRRSSIMIDMDISSLPPTRSASPERGRVGSKDIEEMEGNSDLFARKAGLGKLMKSAKQDVKVPEFDMNAFF